MRLRIPLVSFPGMRLLRVVVAAVVAVLARPLLLHLQAQYGSEGPAEAPSPTPLPSPTPSATPLPVEVWGEDWGVEALRTPLVSPWSAMNATVVRARMCGFLSGGRGSGAVAWRAP